MGNKIKNKKFVGFWTKYNRLYGLWQHNPQKPIPAIPASEVERDYVPKAELARWETLWKNAKKVVAGNYSNAEKWEKRYRNLSKKIEMVKQDYVHKGKIREAIDEVGQKILYGRIEQLKNVLQKPNQKVVPYDFLIIKYQQNLKRKLGLGE